MLRQLLALVVGSAWIAISWYLTFTGGSNIGPYSLVVAPIVTGLIAGRTTAGAVVGFIPNFLLGVAVGVIILGDLSRVSPGSLESVIGLFGLLGAAILAVVGGLVGAVCGGIGGLVGGHFIPDSKRKVAPTTPTAPAPVTTSPGTQNSLTKACPKCLSTWASATRFCPNCGANL